jgi:hypothetical protein
MTWAQPPSRGAGCETTFHHFVTPSGFILGEHQVERLPLETSAKEWKKYSSFN